MSNNENNLSSGNPTDVGSRKLLISLTLGLGVVGTLLTMDIVLDILGIYGRFHIWFEAGSLVGILGVNSQLLGHLRGCDAWLFGKSNRFSFVLF